MRKSVVVIVMIVVILFLCIWAQSNEKLNTVLPIAHILEISKGALLQILSRASDLLGELATRAGEEISAILLDLFKILTKVASDLDAGFRSVLHRPII